MQFLRLFSLLCVLGVSVAHPGELEEHGTPAKREFLSFARRSINACQDKIAARGIASRAIERRSFLAGELRKKCGLPAMRKRDFTSVLNTDHHSNVTGLTADSPADDVFTGGLDCVLQPEVTEGPYFVEGELIRANSVEGHAGVPLYVDVQIVDVSTCEPVPNTYLDFWHCNSTGVYSGIIANGNGDSSDASNINNTFNRAVQPTDADGVAYFETTFPGHYTGRTPHVHVLATLNTTLLPNNTLDGRHIAHVGQVFFDQSLITTVEEVAPYSSNTQQLTLNSKDNIMAEEAAEMDPVVKYVYLGDSVSDGILAWITIGLDSALDKTVSAAATWTANGGVANPNAGGPGGPPGGFPSAL